MLQDLTSPVGAPSDDPYRLLFAKVANGLALYEILFDEKAMPRDYRFLDVNPAFERLTGLRRAEVIGKRVQEILPNTESLWLETYGRVVLTGESAHFENYVRALDRCFAISVYMPCPGRLAVLFVDVTERKRVEEQLRKLSRAVEQSPASIIITDTTGKIEYVNPQFTAITGYAFAEVNGMNPRILKSGETSAADYTRLWETITTGGTWRGEFHNRKKNGETYWESAVISPIFDPAGNITHFVAVKEDIEQRKQRERELLAIAQVSTALRVAHTRAEMLPVMLEQVRQLFDAPGASFDAYDSVSGGLVIEAASGIWATATGKRIPPNTGFGAHIIATGQPYLSNAVRDDPRLLRTDLLGDCNTLAGAPLIAQQQPIGILWAARQKAMGEADVRLLAAIADIAANALHRTTLYEQTEQRLCRLDALSTIDRAISSGLDLRVTLDILLSQVTVQLRADAAAVLLFNPNTQMLEHIASRGFRGNAITRMQVRLGEGHAGRALLERATLFMPRISETYDPARAALFRSENLHAYFVTPLIAKGIVKGVLEIFYRAPFQPDSEWVDFFEMLGKHAAIAVDNADLFDGLQRSNSDLMLAYDATLEGWSRALDLRDRETEGHTRRVVEMTLRLANVMGIPDSDLVHIRRGALLHDIGKIGIPDAILLKPGVLDESERRVIQLHPQYAYQWLEAIAYLRPAVDIPYCHHEKWDGTGYPRRASRAEIPLAARIFAVVDVWDALRSARPYRPAWTAEKARVYLREQAGAHFDPDVVKLFLELGI